MRAFLSTSVRKGSRVGATYSISVSSLSHFSVEEDKSKLTLLPKGSFGPAPAPVVAWFQDGEDVHLPRFYGMKRYGPAEEDERTVGAEMGPLPFEGALTPVQMEAERCVMAKNFAPDGEGGCIVCIPCGMGKTVLAVHLLTQRLRRKAFVMVHKKVIRDQWKESLERFCPSIRVAFLDDTLDSMEDVDVVIGMVLTVAKRTLPPSLARDVGTVCVDECHHMAAPVMSTAMRKFKAHFILGLTATKERPDGLTPLLHWTLGPEGYRVDRKGGESVRVSIALYPPCIAEVRTRDGQPLSSVMTTKLASHAGRNRFLADRVAAMRRAGRVVMVLSDRIAQLKSLHDLLHQRGVPLEELGLFHGSTKEAERTVQLSRPVVLCSYGMANEGLDKKEADTCVMATPKGRVVQCIGRIQRPCPTKMSPLVLDVADDFSIYTQLRWKRQKLYGREKYEVQLLDATAASEGDWFV